MVVEPNPHGESSSVAVAAPPIPVSEKGHDDDENGVQVDVVEDHAEEARPVVVTPDHDEVKANGGGMLSKFRELIH